MDAIDDAGDTPESDDVGHNVEPGTSAAGAKPFTVKTRKTNVPYTFKNFTSARQGTDLFSGSAGSLKEKSDLYEAIFYRLEELKDELNSLREKGVVANGGTDTFLIPIDYLTIDETWCREKRVDWKHVAEIVVNFDEGSMSLPTVTVRRIFSPAGKLVDVVISLTDGVHRTTGLKELGYTHVRALVQIVDDVEDEAKVYSNHNYNRRAHAKHDIIKVQLALNDPKLLKIKEILGDYGFVFPERSGKRCAWPQMGAIQTVIKCFDRYGEDILRRALWLLSRKEFSLWYGNATAIHGDFIGGLCRYIDTFEKPGYIHSTMTEHMMTTNSPDFLHKLGRSFGNPDVTNIMNCTVFQHSESGANGEGARMVRTCAAFVAAIRETFKPSKAASRPANYHPKFKDALDVYYDNAKDARDKADAILTIRRAMAKRKQPDCWFTESSIVR
ncbi:hypothetical protein EBZ39_00375 [bacterium]|nr:hypothetical protein [bacterium]